MLCMWWCSDTSYYIAIMGYMISGGVHHMDAQQGHTYMLLSHGYHYACISLL